EGMILEEGGHDQLLERQGSYYDFWNKQVDGLASE
ncbi:MAG: hypothetical protein UT61_C0044G0001, partial [Candidatus Woesebacteria bacterium GW2011_GWA1_39_8]